MGNRAFVIFTNSDETVISPAIYLHWNGGAESIYGFLDELNRRNIRCDQNYEAARMVSIICEFFDQDKYGGLSVGISNGPCRITEDELESFDHGDNGAYIICRSWNSQKQAFHNRVKRFRNGAFMPFNYAVQEELAARKSDYLSLETGIPSVYSKTKEIER